MTVEQILIKLKLRNTRLRRVILSILIRTSQPISAPEILEMLASNDLRPNKTTIYRELEQLKNYQAVTEIVMSDGIRRYELTKEGHFHHLVCLDCGQIDKIEMPNDLDTHESTILKTKDFSVSRHDLVFYGNCKDCRK